MTDTATFIPTDDDDYSHFDEGSLEWKACRERDAQAAVALDEMFDAQKQGGEAWLAWVEKHRGAEARKELERKQRLCREEADRYWQWRNWMSSQRDLKEREYRAIPIYAPMPLEEWVSAWNRYIWQAEEDYKQRMNDIWSGKYRGEERETDQANEVADDTILDPEKLAESSESTEALRNDSVFGLPKLNPSDLLSSLDNQSDKKAEAHQANEAGDDTVSTPEKFSESSESAETLRNDSVVELPKLEQSDLSQSLDDQSNEEFPSLPSAASPFKDKSESPHPKSLYRTSNPLILVSPPPPAETTIQKVETSTRQTGRQLRPASSSTAHKGNDDLAGPRTVVLKKRPAAASPSAAKQQIKEKLTANCIAQDDASETRPEKVELPAEKEHISTRQTVSTPKKQRKPITETIATPAPVGVSGPISGRKRKVKNFASSQAPQAPRIPRFSVQATGSKPASAATASSPALVPQTEAKKRVVDVSGATKPSEESGVAVNRNVASEGRGKMVVRFVAMLLFLILAFFLGYALGM